VDVTAGGVTFRVCISTYPGKAYSHCAPTVSDAVMVVVEVVVLVELTVLVGVGLWRQSQALEIIDVA